MSPLAPALLKCLREMDLEACLPRGASPTGLAWFGGHREPEKKRPRTEPCWSQRLAELLPAHGFPAQAEVRYPSAPRDKCDVVASLPDGSAVWVEVKGAWKEYWRGKSELIYRSYLLHPLVPGLDTSKSHTAALDLVKLNRLKPPDASPVLLRDREREHRDGVDSASAGMISADAQPPV
jgi:hypothetical protein